MARITRESAAAAANLPRPSITFSVSVRRAANALDQVADGDLATNAAHGANKHSKNATVFMLDFLICNCEKEMAFDSSTQVRGRVVDV